MPSPTTWTAVSAIAAGLAAVGSAAAAATALASLRQQANRNQLHETDLRAERTVRAVTDFGDIYRKAIRRTNKRFNLDRDDALTKGQLDQLNEEARAGDLDDNPQSRFLFFDIRDALNAAERLAKGAELRVYDTDIIFDLIGTNAVRLFNVFRVYVESARRAQPRSLESFEKMALDFANRKRTERP